MTSYVNPLKGMGTGTARLRYVGGVLFRTVLFGKRIFMNSEFTCNFIFQLDALFLY